MGSVLDKMREEALRLEKTKKQFDEVNWYRPDDGDNMIRILPTSLESNDVPFVRKLVHYLPTPKNDGTGMVNVPVVCLQQVDQPCPACELYEKLKSEKNEGAADLRQSDRFLYNVIAYGVSGKRESQVCVYAAPVSVHKEIIFWAGELDTEFWDINKGRDWKLKKLIDKSKGKFGVSYKVIPGQKDTSIPEKIKPELNKMVDLAKLWGEPSREKILELLPNTGFDVATLAAKGSTAALPKAQKTATKTVAAMEDDRESQFGDDEEPPFAPEKKAKAETPVATKSTKTTAKVMEADDDDLDVETDEELDDAIRNFNI